MTHATRQLNVTLPRLSIQRLWDTARAFDVAKDPGNVYEACGCGLGGMVQFWSRPTDKPDCWDAPLTSGAWGQSDLVGDLHWDWLDDGQTASLRVEVYARELHDYRLKRARNEWYKARQQGNIISPPDRRNVLAEADNACLLDWLESKARALLRLASLAPVVLGLRCPYCDWMLPVGRLLNDLLDHVTIVHPEVKILSVNLGSPTILVTTAGKMALQEVESFSE